MVTEAYPQVQQEMAKTATHGEVNSDITPGHHSNPRIIAHSLLARFNTNHEAVIFLDVARNRDRSFRRIKLHDPDATPFGLCWTNWNVCELEYLRQVGSTNHSLRHFTKGALRIGPLQHLSNLSYFDDIQQPCQDHRIEGEYFVLLPPGQ